MTLDGPRLDLKITLDHESLDYIRIHKPGVAILPLLQNVSGSKWDGAGLQALLANPARRAALLDKITVFLAANKLQGVTVDFEEVPRAAYGNLGIFLSDMSAAFASRGWIIAQAAPFDDDSWPYKAYADIVDYTVLMAYDEADESVPPGAIAGQDWFERVLDQRMKVLPPDSTIIALGSYAYDWENGKAGANVLSFQEAMEAARDAGAMVQFDDATNNPHFTYREDNGTRHDVWLLDGATVFNQIHTADLYQPAGYALWRLGAEDPTIVSLLGRRYSLPAPKDLEHIATTDDVDFDPPEGGEILQVQSDPAPAPAPWRSSPRPATLSTSITPICRPTT